MAVIGAILGDIAGSLYEFYRPKDLDWNLVNYSLNRISTLTIQF